MTSLLCTVSHLLWSLESNVSHLQSLSDVWVINIQHILHWYIHRKVSYLPSWLVDSTHIFVY
jgi:hypothetical protein